MKADKLSIVNYLKEIKSELQKDGISKIALFGSFARNEQNVYSDIDIAIQKENDYLTKRSAYDYFEEVAKIKNLLRRKFHRNSDIFDLDSNNTMMQSIYKDLIYV